jgi:hypothetical protein
LNGYNGISASNALDDGASRELELSDGAGRPVISYDFPRPPAGSAEWPWDEPLEGAEAGASAAVPRVTVIVPSFNQGRFIEATLRSILLQNYPNLELIVMDGGSKDETVELLKKYNPWIEHWVSEKDRGQTHAINKGLALATGEIVTYLNSDDLLHPGAIQKIVASFEANPDVDVVVGECIYVDAGGVERFRQRAQLSDLASYLRIWERFPTGNYITQPEAFIRSAALKRVGPFREELHSVMDFEMWVRLLAAGSRFLSIPTPIAHFRTHPLQKSSVDTGHELFQVIESYLDHLPGGGSGELAASIRRDLPAARAQLLVRAAQASNIYGSYGKAVGYCVSAARQDWSVVRSYPFWSVLADPLKVVVPRGGKTRIRQLLKGE